MRDLRRISAQDLLLAVAPMEKGQAPCKRRLRDIFFCERKSHQFRPNYYLNTKMDTISKSDSTETERKQIETFN
jgi:hypothetical protein